MAVAKGEYIIEIAFIDGQTKMKIDGLTKGFVKLETGLKRLKLASQEASEATEDLGKKNLDMMSKAGLAGATLTEIGRTISDLPYGIRGVANNISQLSTLFVTLVSTTGGLSNAIKLLRTQLAGPLGVVLAIQAVVAALDYFAGRSSKATDEIDAFGNKFGESAAKLRSYKAILNDSAISADEKRRVVKQVAIETDGLNVELDENNQLTSESSRLLDKNIERLKEQAEVRALLDRLTELNTDKLKLEYQLRQELGSEYSTFMNTLNTVGSAIGGAGGVVGLLGLDKIQGITGSISTVNDEIADIIEQLRGRTLDVFDPIKTSKRGRKIVDDFNIYFTKKQDELAVLSARGEINRLRELNAQKSNILLIQRNKRTEKEKELLEKGLITEQQFLDRKVDLHGLYLDQIAELNKKTEEDILNVRLDALLSGAEILSSLGDQFLESEISREERKTVLMNNQLKERLRNENLSAKEKESINAQIEANEENLQKKRDKLAEKQFKIQKAMNIANALVETYRSAQLAYASQLVPGDPTTLIRAQIARGIAIALGLANVAMIARQQFVPSALSAGGGAGGAGGGGGATIEAPDFNVVGASQTSQLAQTVAGQQAKPIRAFVVGKDISTQQELDRNITNTASLG